MSGAARVPDNTIISVKGLKLHFPSSLSGATVKAVDGVDFDIMPRETLGIIGESGSGKSTIGRALAGLLPPSEGNILYEGEDLSGLSRKEYRLRRSRYQIIFQDPNAALNPRMTILASLLEPMHIQGRLRASEMRAKAFEALERVGLRPDTASSYPHQLSGGQKQRVNIARILSLAPKLVVCDEVVAALDLSIRGEILNIFTELQAALGISYAFITHDISVVAHVSNRIAVTYLGRFMEMGGTQDVTERPFHPYTAALLSAEPVALPSGMRRRSAIELKGEIPSPVSPPSGCRFRTRCPYAQTRCGQEEPEWRELAPDHFVACHFAGDKAFSENLIREMLGRS